ncbi:MAG: HAD-IIIC family phosphatase [Caldimonas sp.]
MPTEPVAADFGARLKRALATDDDPVRLETLRTLADAAPGYIETIQLDRVLTRVAPATIDAHLTRLRLAMLSSATIAQLLPGLRVAALRRGFFLDVYTGGFGQYRNELLDPASPVQAFAPDVVLLSLSARQLAGAIPLDADVAHVERVLSAEVAELRGLWNAARNRFGASVLQQTCLDVHEPLFGSLDRQIASAPARVVARFNDLLSEAASTDGVAVLDVAGAAARDGIDFWFDNARWLQGKMEIAPQAGARYGELAMRIVAAQRGRSRKCLVLDLDNTLWGGVVGDVGIEGLVLGEGSAVGEAHLELQRHARRLKERGVILAVCSKNEPAIAEQAFARHPEMVLRRDDIACFVANWKDKAENLSAIAEQLNIGLDSLVFVDDNPAERARIRSALPMVAVPELPDDPAGYVRALAGQGYFEAVSFTREDTQRAGSYAANAQREALRGSAQSMDDFLRGLEMRVIHGPVGGLELERATQLINKTNQFNITGRRYLAQELAQLAADDANITLQFRLSDRLGESGLVSVMILRAAGSGAGELEVDTWVMSCRVFGRQLEDEAMNIAVEHARSRGTKSLRARYVPTGRNGVVSDLFRGLGFEPAGEGEAGGPSVWRLPVAAYAPRKTFIHREGEAS